MKYVENYLLCNPWKERGLKVSCKGSAGIQLSRLVLSVPTLSSRVRLPSLDPDLTWLGPATSQQRTTHRASSCLSFTFFNSILWKNMTSMTSIKSPEQNSSDAMGKRCYWTVSRFYMCMGFRSNTVHCVQSVYSFRDGRLQGCGVPCHPACYIWWADLLK